MNPMIGMRTAVAASAAALALLAAACGGKAATTTATSTTVTVAPATTQPTATSTPTTSVTATTTAASKPTGASKPTVVDDVLQGGTEADRYSYELKFPKLQDLASAAVQDSVNAQIRADMAVGVEAFVSGATDPGVSFPPPPAPASRLAGAYEVSRLDDRLASLRVTVSSYFAGAAHPGAKLTTFNFDLHTGKRLSLSDLFVAGSPYLTRLSELSGCSSRPRWLPWSSCGHHAVHR